MASFDDGRDEIPTGLEGAVTRVVIVGAGMAGLTAASALAREGVECLVLEARDRIGGRLHTVDLAGAPIDMGGSWIHTPVGNPMSAFADQVGVERRDGNFTNEAVVFDQAVGRALSESELEAVFELVLVGFPEALDGLRTDLGDGASAADGIEEFLAARQLDPDMTRRVGRGCMPTSSLRPPISPRAIRFDGCFTRSSMRATSWATFRPVGIAGCSRDWRPASTCAWASR